MGKHDKPEHDIVPFLIFFDLDGVTVDYDLGCKEAGSKYVKCPWEAKNIPGFFTNLKPLGNSIEEINEIEKLYPGHVRFLTSATFSRPEAWTEKVLWYQKHFPALHKRLIITSDKGACGSENDILIDDNPTWNGADRFKGTVIKFSNHETDWEIVKKIIKQVSERNSN